MITFVPMTSQETRSWLGESVVDFATGLSASTGLDHDDALDQANAQLEKILPQRENSPGHEFYWITHDGHRVGRVWFGPSLTDEACLYIWDVSVDLDHQGRGFGGAALDAIAKVARQRESSSVALSVFGSNPDARRLYERKGYVAGDPVGGQVAMRLDLRED